MKALDAWTGGTSPDRTMQDYAWASLRSATQGIRNKNFPGTTRLVRTAQDWTRRGFARLHRTTLNTAGLDRASQGNASQHKEYAMKSFHGSAGFGETTHDFARRYYTSQNAAARRRDRHRKATKKSRREARRLSTPNIERCDPVRCLRKVSKNKNVRICILPQPPTATVTVTLPRERPPS